MVGPIAQKRGVTISPLLVVVTIFAGLLVIEGLLVARFWIQLAASSASEGLQGAVMDASRPLVAPFDGPSAAARQTVGSFELDTLVAAMVYLAGAALLAAVTVLAGGLIGGRQRLATRRRRSFLQQLESPLPAGSGTRLIGMASLAMRPSQAVRALRMLRLDRWSADLYVIPAGGGCIVAAFEDGKDGWLGRWVTRANGVRATRRALRSIERRFQPVAAWESSDA